MDQEQCGDAAAAVGGGPPCACWLACLRIRMAPYCQQCRGLLLLWVVGHHAQNVETEVHGCCGSRGAGVAGEEEEEAEVTTCCDGAKF